MERPNLGRWVEKVKSSFQPAQPSEDLLGAFDDIRTAKISKGSPFYGVLPSGYLNMETYTLKGGIESGYYDVETKHTKFVYPFTRSACGELTIDRPILLPNGKQSEQ